MDAASTYQHYKLMVLNVTNLHQDAMHVHLGMLAFLLSVMLLRRGRIDTLALAPVVLLAGTMEFLDLWDDLDSRGAMRWSESIKDFINTILWPGLLVLFSRALK